MPVEFSVLPHDLPLPDLLGDDGYLKLLPACRYDVIEHPNLRAWCHYNARYGLPTSELIDWLQPLIAGKVAIEIGAGSADLAHHLGIPATDNRMQEWPGTRAYYDFTGQPVIRYPEKVQNLDALAAVQKYQPDVVLASWVTEWIDPNLPVPEQGGNIWGVKEDLILDQGITYILIGNISVHGRKKIMSLPHEELHLPFLRSRAIRPELNRVWAWNL